MFLEYLDTCERNEDAQQDLQKYRLIAAMYKALFHGKNKLGDKIEAQIKENEVYLVGDFDGFCHCSTRSNAKYRDLEDMYSCGALTGEEYNFCNV